MPQIDIQISSRFKKQKKKIPRVNHPWQMRDSCFKPSHFRLLLFGAEFALSLSSVSNGNCLRCGPWKKWYALLFNPGQVVKISGSSCGPYSVLNKCGLQGTKNKVCTPYNMLTLKPIHGQWTPNTSNNPIWKILTRVCSRVERKWSPLIPLVPIVLNIPITASQYTESAMW